MDDVHPCDYAFPVAPGDVPYWQPGMSLRDYMATASLQQAVEDYTRKDHTGNPLLPHAAKPIGTREDIIARQAYRYADAMLKARAQ